jgi:hypothetical protein
MRIYLWLLMACTLNSCWKYSNRKPTPDPAYPGRKVWGYKPVYGTEGDAKKISYIASPQAAVSHGNIYAFRNYIFQIDPGFGIHVIDNTTPSSAHKIGFIEVRGCSQISIKNDKLYTNSYDDLVVLDFSDLQNVHEYSRLKGIFTEYKYESPISTPPGRGYYECPSYDKLVTGWVMDSIYLGCNH